MKKESMMMMVKINTLTVWRGIRTKEEKNDEKNMQHRRSGSHSDSYEEFCVLKYNAV
jgi:hypothetical protein